MARLTRAEFCARAPKVELHVHLDGAFDSAYLFECATKYVEDLPATVNLLGGKSVRLQEAVRSSASPQAFLERFVHLPPTTAKLTDFLAPFPLSMAIVKAAVRAVGLEAIEEFAYRFAQRQHASNALYTEVRYCPHLFLEDAQLSDPAERLAAAEEVVRAVGRGLHRGEQQWGVLLRQILCCLDYAPQWSADCAALLQTIGREGGLVGIDVAAGEAHFAEATDAPTRRAVLAAKRLGFGVSIHAGEDPNSGGTAANVRCAIENYGANRIGHGYALLQDEAVLEIARDRAVHIEACPTSSWLTGGFGPKTRPWSEHPVRAFHRHGLSCCVSTDDPAIANICLVDEWRRCLDDVGMRASELRQMAAQGVEAAFCSEEDKATLRRRFASFYAECELCAD